MRGSGSTVSVWRGIPGRRREHDVVVAGEHERAFGRERRVFAPHGGDRVVVFDGFRARTAQVPDEAVRAGFGRWFRGGFRPRFGEVAFGLDRRRLVVAREALHDARLAVGTGAFLANLDDDLLRRLRERVVDDRAGRRIRAERGVGRRRRVLVLAAAQADRGRGREQVRVGVRGFASQVWRSGVTSSSTQIARPCVAAIRSLPWTSRSRTQATGRLRCSGCQCVAVVEGDVGAGVGAGVEQALAHGIGAHDGDEMAVRQSVRDLRPGLAVVVRAHGDRVEIVLPVIVDGGVGGARIERG